MSRKICSRRLESWVCAGVVITPHLTRACRFRSVSTTPKPMVATPGSIPKMRIKSTPKLILSYFDGRRKHPFGKGRMGDPSEEIYPQRVCCRTQGVYTQKRRGIASASLLHYNKNIRADAASSANAGASAEAAPPTGLLRCPAGRPSLPRCGRVQRPGAVHRIRNRGFR